MTGAERDERLATIPEPSSLRDYAAKGMCVGCGPILRGQVGSMLMIGARGIAVELRALCRRNPNETASLFIGGANATHR